MPIDKVKVYNFKRDNKKVEKLKELALNYLDNCSYWIREKAAAVTGSGLKEVLEEKDLKKYIQDNKRFPNRCEMAQAKLNGEDISENPEFVMQSLWDISFDVDVYKAIGVNDGQLDAAKKIFTILGMHKKAKECSSWMYQMDV